MLTGNFNVVKNEKLRKLFAGSPMYWQNKTTYSEKATTNLIFGLEDSVDTWCVKNGQLKSNLLERKQKIIEMVDINMKYLLEKKITVIIVKTLIAIF